jgi:RecJ-like exonuclease
MPWYPKKTGNAGEQECPVCSGTGKRVDAVTKKERDCVLCIGHGYVPQKFIEKGNAIPIRMTRYEMDRIMNVIDQTK